jgi:branched-chain amino acid transport system permease protein
MIFSFQLIVNISISFFIYFICAFSFSTIYFPTKFFHFAHAVIITFAAYFSYVFFKQLHFSIYFSIPIAISLSICLGLLIELGIYKPLRKRNSSSLVLLIASLGLYVVLQNCISLIWGDDTKSIRTGDVKVGNEIFGAYITNTQILIVVLGAACFVLGTLFLKYNKIGRNIRAVASNPELANIFGIDSDRVILWAFGIGSGLAAIAGILVALDTDMTPTMGFNLLLYGVVAMIIGGVGSTWGLVGGALLLASAQHLAAYYIDSKWMDAVAYVILILFLIWKPLGFSGKRLKKVEI